MYLLKMLNKDTGTLNILCFERFFLTWFHTQWLKMFFIPFALILTKMMREKKAKKKKSVNTYCTGGLEIRTLVALYFVSLFFLVNVEMAWI